MEFRRQGMRDQRRRRVCLEDTPEETPASSRGPSRTTSGSQPLRQYAEAARCEHQPRVTDLIPTRRWTVLVLMLLALTQVAGLLALYVLVDQNPRAPVWVRDAAFQPLTLGSLATWWSSAMLLLATTVAIGIYWLRRHKLDDYRGRYRVWLWAAVWLLLWSIHHSAPLNGILGGLLALGLPSYGPRVHANLEVLVVSLLVLAVAARLVIEMRRSWGAALLLLLAMVSFSLALSFRLEVITATIPFLNELFQAAAHMTAVLSVTASSLLYLRYVYLDAHDALPRTGQREPRRLSRWLPRWSLRWFKLPRFRSSSDGEADQEAGTSRSKTARTRQRSDLGSSASEAKTQQHPANKADQQAEKATSGSSQPPAANTANESCPDVSEAGMSRAEKRRLRKQRRREQKAAA